MTLGTTARVRELTNTTSSELPEEKITSALSEAESVIRANYGSYAVDEKIVQTNRATGEVQKKFSLFFPAATSTDVKRVAVNGGVLSASDYSYDKEFNELTINTTIGERDIITVHYKPSFYDDYANYLAAKSILAPRMVNTWNGTQMSAVYDRIQAEVERFEAIAKSKPIVARYVDHLEDYDIW